MYINKIDEIVDNVLDDFYNKVVKEKDTKTYFNEVNFVKYQKEVNQILQDYTKTIDVNAIDKVINNVDGSNKVVEYIKKYLAFYVFMTFGFYYSQKMEMYINNIVEFSKNQAGFGLKINGFFNSESNALLIEFYNMIKNILLILDSDNAKIEQLKKKTEFKNTFKFLDELGSDIVEHSFKLKNLKGNVGEQAHNIIKSIILIQVYIKIDKVEMYQIIEKSDIEQGEFIYIDIVIPQYDFIDFNTIEMSLSKKDAENGLANEIYDLITKESDVVEQKTHEDKVVELINRKIIIPVSEDFLLYHKDTEKYEKPLDVIQESTKKKKEDTQVKYIVNKIDTASEYFSKNIQEKPEAKKNIEKLFYTPLSDKRVVLVNTYEDIKIIYKLQNQGRHAIENNEFYNDLVNYMHYPYINFKEFQKYGFGLVLNNTVDVIRSVNFEKANENNKNKNVQVRVNCGDRPLNIVGFVIPSKFNDVKCLKLKNFVDIRKVGYNSESEDGKKERITNGYDGALRVIGKNIGTSKNRNRPAIVWMFDLDKDKVKFDTYELNTSVSDSEYIKLMVSSIYDNLLEIIKNEVIKLINRKKEITLQEFYAVLNKIDRNIIDFPRDSKLYNELQKFVFQEKYSKTNDVYDKKEDAFPGLLGDIKKLPSAKQKEKEKITTIRLQKFRKADEKKVDDESEISLYNAICQHNITWDNITAIRKKNPNKSNEMLFEFFQQYVVQNHESEYVCKSCGMLINLKNYVLDGSYDDDGRFVSFNMPMEIPLEEIPEYEKYKASIRNIEKDIDKIASIANIRTLSGTSSVIRTRVRYIVKDTIDLLLIHNNNLKAIYKERSEKISIYGLNKDLSNLFIFELDNNIFVYSSKDKDFYKPIKRNNITIYSLFLMMLEISDTQLYYMVGDKICNYNVFLKYGISWFNGINIRKNNQNTIAPILNYKVLCYIIFYTSCLITKYNLWKYEDVESSKDKQKKFNPNIQKIVIHTLIDFINSILEMYSKKKHHYIYDILATKFFQKLNSTYKNEEVLARIKMIEDKKISADDKKGMQKGTKIAPIPLANDFKPIDYLDTSTWIDFKIAKSFVRQKKDTFQRYFNINNNTNCESGTFHKWVTKGKYFACNVCGKRSTETGNNSQLDKAIVKNYNIKSLAKIAQKYCQTDEFQNYITSNKIKCPPCVKCKDTASDNFESLGENELYDVVDNVKNMTMHVTKLSNENNLQKFENKHDKVINELKESYGKSKQHKEDYFKFVDTFITKIETILGKNVNLHGKDIFLKMDSYIVNHDHNGYIIDKPFVIKDDGKTIISKKNHPFFKKNVISYINYKLQIEIFYDATTMLLVGYKEKNKEYQIPKNKNIYIRINESIYSKLKKMGYVSKHISIKNMMNTYMELFKDENLALREIIAEISRNRILQLKKNIGDIQRYVFRMAYDFKMPPVDEENDPNKFLDAYKNKLDKMILRDETKGKFLKHWKIIKDELFFESIANKTININPQAEFISTDDINIYDYTGNIILFYIVREMEKLLDINNDKFIKETLGYLILDIINQLHNEYNDDKNLTNTEIKRFKYSLEIKDEREIAEVSGTTEGIYEEYKDPDAEVNEEELELKEDDIGETEGFDMEEPDDYDNVDYASGINFNM